MFPYLVCVLIVAFCEFCFSDRDVSLRDSAIRSAEFANSTAAVCPQDSSSWLWHCCAVMIALLHASRSATACLNLDLQLLLHWSSDLEIIPAVTGSLYVTWPQHAPTIVQTNVSSQLGLKCGQCGGPGH